MLTKRVYPLSRQFAGYAVPTVFAAWIFCCHSVIGGIFIGRYVGEEALAALNLMVPLLYLPYAFSIMIGVGGSTLFARLLGERRNQEAAVAFTQALWLLSIGGVLLSLVVLVWAPQFVRLTGATGQLAVLAEGYLRAYAPFIVFSTICYALELFLRVEGAAKFGLYCLAAGAVADVALTWLVVVHLHWGIAGAALASGLSQTVACLPMLAYHFLHARHAYPVRRAFAKCSYATQIAYNGLSELLGEIAPSVTVFAFNHVVLRWLGESGLVAFAILEYMTMIASVTLVALVQSMQPMVSFYRGAKNGEAMRTSFRIGVVVTLGFACLAAGAMLLFAHPLTELFVPNSENAWRVLRDAVPWVAMAIVPAALNIAVAGYLTAIEAPLESMIIALLRSWLLLLGLLFLLTFLFEGQGIWMTTVTTEVLTFAASAWLYLARGKHAQVFAV